MHAQDSSAFESGILTFSDAWHMEACTHAIHACTWASAATTRAPATTNYTHAGKKADKKGLGLNNSKAANFSDWYTELVVASELISYYDVSGCYILRPYAFAIWDEIKNWFDARIKELGVQVGAAGLGVGTRTAHGRAGGSFGEGGPDATRHKTRISMQGALPLCP